MAKHDDAREAWERLASLFFSDEQHERFHQVAEDLGLPHPGVLKVLVQLDTDAPPTMSDIARSMKCDNSYVTVLVDALEQPGFVERRVHPDDRRVKTIHLTDEGEGARTRAFELMYRPPERMNRLTASELRELSRLLGKLVDD